MPSKQKIMPAALLAPLITAGASLLGSGINAASTGANNRKQRDWNIEMYNRQRQDSLADFMMQNDYNSPASQMARLREAGLNPNLIYKNGATTEAAPIRSSSVEGWKPTAPQWDIGGAANTGLASYYDTQLKQAQIDNLKADNTVKTQDALLRSAQVVNTTASTGKTVADTESTKFDTALKNEIKEYSVEAARTGIQKTHADIDSTKASTKSTLDANERAAALQASNLTKAVEEILTLRANRATNSATRDHIRQQIENLKSDNELKQLDLDLRRMGINPNDPMYWRVLGRVINGVTTPGGAKNIGKATGHAIQSLLAPFTR